MPFYTFQYKIMPQNYTFQYKIPSGNYTFQYKSMIIANTFLAEFIKHGSFLPLQKHLKQYKDHECNL